MNKLEQLQEICDDAFNEINSPALIAASLYQDFLVNASNDLGGV